MNALAHSGAAVGALAVAPLLAAGLALRPAWRAGFSERLGTSPRGAAGGIWVHAASVGELQAALPLVAALERAGERVLASTFTPTARALLAGRRPGLPATLAPLDHPWCVERALARVRPRALVLVETELWPAWIRAADRRSIPVLLVSGRISDRSFSRYAKLSRWFAPTLQRLERIGARSESDRGRFVALGAHPERVCVSGDLKLDPLPPRPLDAALERALRGRPLVVAGSTHPGEEQLLLDAHARSEIFARSALVLAPRQLRRAPEIVRLCEARGRRVRLRSRLGALPIAPGEVLVLDSLGELASLYALATVAFVGGSLARVGGHNPLEAAAAGVPVLHGPHVASVRAALELLSGAGAAREVADAESLARAVSEWLEDPAAARRIGAAGRRVLAPHRGAAERSAELVLRAVRCGPS